MHLEAEIEKKLRDQKDVKLNFSLLNFDQNFKKINI